MYVLDGGSNRYQFVHADDLADACLRALDRPGPATYNIGADEFGTMRETLQALVDHAGTGSRVRSLPSAPARLAMKVLSTVGATPFAPYHWLLYGESLWFDTTRAADGARLGADAFERRDGHRVLRVVPRAPRRARRGVSTTSRRWSWERSPSSSGSADGTRRAGGDRGRRPSPTQRATPRPRRAGATAGSLAVLAGALALPLLVAAVAVRRPTWFPVLDLAMTELRLRDVGTSHTPLIGLPGTHRHARRAGQPPRPAELLRARPGVPAARVDGVGDAGRHGRCSTSARSALSLWMAAPAWRSRRSSSPWRVVLALLAAGYGIAPLIEPVEPVPAGAVVGRRPARRVVGARRRRRHAPGGRRRRVVLRPDPPALPRPRRRARRRRRRRPRPAAAPDRAAERRPPAPRALDGGERRPRGAAVAPAGDRPARERPRQPVPPRRSPRHAARAARSVCGKGVELALLHLDVPDFFGADRGGDRLARRRVRRTPRARSSPGSSPSPCGPPPPVGPSRTAGPSRRWRGSTSSSAAALVLGVISMSRIFGKVWYYLMLWAWGTAALAPARRRLDGRGRPARPGAARDAPAGLAAPRSSPGSSSSGVSTVAFTAAAVDAPPPSATESSILGGLLPGTVAALERGDGAAVGRDGRYLVTWTDAYYFGSQGYGLVSELERDGFDARAEEHRHVPITDHRVIDLAGRGRRDGLPRHRFVHRRGPGPARRRRGRVRRTPRRGRTGGVRSPARRCHRRARPRPGSTTSSRSSTATSSAPRSTSESTAPTQRKMARMLELGQPAAVFVAPAGTSL